MEPELPLSVAIGLPQVRGCRLCPARARGLLLPSSNKGWGREPKLSLPVRYGPPPLFDTVGFMTGEHEPRRPPRQRSVFARLLRRTLVLSTVMIVGVIVTAIATSGSPSAGKAIPWVAVPVFLVVPVVIQVRKARGTMLLDRVANTNGPGPAVASPSPVARPEAALGHPGLTLRKDRRIVVRGFLTLLATACGAALGEWYFLAHETGLGRDAGAVVALVFLVVALALAVFYAFYLVRWILPGHPLIELDARGVYHARLGYLLPWSDVTEIRLYPFRAASTSPALLGSAPHVMVAFIPADPDAILRAIPGNPFRKWQQRRAFLTYGSPMVIASLTVDHPAEEIIQTATALSGLPLRRY